MTNSQIWLDKKYPREKRSEVKKIDIGSKSLEREFDCVVNEKKGIYNLKVAKQLMKKMRLSNDSKVDNELQILQQDQNKK